MILVDVNILVETHREDAGHHVLIRQWVESCLSSPPGLAVSELVLSGCLRVITHPKVFREPTPVSQAVEFIKDFRSRETVHVLAPGPRHWEIFIDLCRRLELRGNSILDAYHAALALETGCEWISLDRGFARFPGLPFRHPLDLE
ncbi:MAG: type II toxin-antitoxin system VapC family toxin [Puniceicoccaceae bacterium]